MKKCKSMCSGCRDNFYNGKGADECWSYEGSNVVKKLLIHIDLAPPYNELHPKEMLSCYSPPRMVRVDPKALTSEGFWKR